MKIIRKQHIRSTHQQENINFDNILAPNVIYYAAKHKRHNMKANDATRIKHELDLPRQSRSIITVFSQWEL